MALKRSGNNKKTAEKAESWRGITCFIVGIEMTFSFQSKTKISFSSKLNVIDHSTHQMHKLIINSYVA